MAILLPFITGVGPGEMETILSMFSLPNSQNYRNTIFRWQPFVCTKIIEISDREMQYAMAEEIKATIIAEQDEEYYESWINKPADQREKIGLVVSYDMGWQKRASGNSYSSKSGHAFVVGMQTKRIIDCVVFSTNCKKCEYKPVEKKKKKNGGGNVDPIEEGCQDEDESGLWTSSISTIQASTLADDGAVAETTIRTSQQETESVSTTIDNVAAPLIIPYRASVNLPPVVTPVKDVHTPTSCYQGYVSSPPAAPIARSPVFCTTFCTPLKERH